jgi:D-alanyl-D-alanine carboxypeptidase
MTSWHARVILPALAAFSLTVAGPAAAERGNPNMSFAGQTIDEMIVEFMAEHDVPGLALAIVQAPYIPRVTGYGVADTEQKRLVASNTLFNLGQMVEAYTAVAIMQLVEMGKLHLDDAVSKYLEDWPAAWGGVSVHHLLMHGSGIPDYTREAGHDPARPPTAMLAAPRPLLFVPGTAVAYSASNYALLGLLVEAASGERYQDFVRRHQFERLGLTHTVFAADLVGVPREPIERNANRHVGFLENPALINPSEPATGYRLVDDRLAKVTAVAPPAVFLPGGLLASAMDVSLWDIGLAGNILVKEPRHRAILYGGARLTDGRAAPVMGGWRFPGRRGLMYVMGSSDGQSAFLSRFTDPGELVCVTLLANKEGVDLTQLARRVAGAYEARLGPPPGSPGMRAQQSPYSVKETIDRLEAELKQGGVGIMARVDHAARAKSAGLELAPTEELIFGHPAAGTQLMFSRRSIALDLPLRALAWEEDGQVWLGYTDPVDIAHRTGVTDRDKTAMAMRHGLDAAVLRAVTPY